MNRRSVTLIELLISIALMSVLIVGLLGAFFISRSGTEIARHRMAAMGIAREYLEQEIGQSIKASSFTNIYYTFPDNNNPITVTIDKRGTDATSDDLLGTIVPNPYPANITTLGTVLTARYKTVGFVVTWIDGVKQRTYTQRLMTYVAERK